MKLSSEYHADVEKGCKICTKCFEKKDLGEFRKRKSPSGYTLLMTLCKKCESREHLIRAQKKKEILVKEFGNRCNNCKKTFDSKVYHFHHMDHNTKENRVGSMFSSRSLKAIRKEVEGCVLLCPTCHYELHHEDWTDNDSDLMKMKNRRQNRNIKRKEQIVSFDRIRKQDITEKMCKTCEKIKPINEFYISQYRNGKRYKCAHSSCISCENDLVREKKRERKLLLVELLGGKCTVCGYNKIKQILQFHHRDQEKKEFMISTNLKKSLHVLKQEALKCDLLCPTCHMDYHVRNGN